MKSVAVTLGVLAGLVVSSAYAAPAKAPNANQTKVEKQMLGENMPGALAGYDFHGGLQFVTMDTNSKTLNSASDYGMSFMAGVGYETLFSGSVFLRPELNFVRKGTSVAAGSGDSRVQGTIRADYIEMPLFFQAKMPRQNSFQMNFIAGPSIAARIGSSTHLQSGSRTQDVTADQMNLETFDYGLQFGMGWDINVSSKTLMMLSMRYSLGIANVTGDEGDEARTSGFQLVTGVKF